MARLFTTPAEKAAASYLDWDDAAIGSFCKKLALIMETRRKEKRAKGIADDDIEAVINAADGLLLIGQVIENDLESLTINFGDFTHRGVDFGEWEITVRQVKP